MQCLGAVNYTLINWTTFCKSLLVGNSIHFCMVIEFLIFTFLRG